MKKVSLAIVDDHKLLRQMWEKIFADHGDIVVVGESGTLEDAIEMVTATRPEVLLLDINLAERSGMDAMPFIRKVSPGTKVITVSMHGQMAYVKRMLALGAKGYITKNSPQEEIFKAIKVVIEGGIYICDEIKYLADIPNSILDTEKISPPALSLREIEIIKLIKDGLSSKEIAALLFISLRTVEVHRRNILKKLSFKNTASLINFVNHNDLNFL